MTLPFLASKTRLPNSFPSLVARPRLVDALNASLHSGVQVTLVTAPAGAGKTTLLSQWLSQLPTEYQVSWLSLDDGDNSLPRFFSYLVAAIPELGSEIAALVETNPAFSVEQVLVYLTEQIEDIEGKLLLVLDDYHTIITQEVHQALKLLIDHIPTNLQLVISGRVEPPLPLARLRARGQLAEIRSFDLRFRVYETADFLTHFEGLEALSGRMRFQSG